MSTDTNPVAGWVTDEKYRRWRESCNRHLKRMLPLDRLQELRLREMWQDGYQVRRACKWLRNYGRLHAKDLR